MLRNEQEEFWSKDFGNEYINRNNSKEIFFNKKNLFEKIFSNIEDSNSLIEFGANIGLNLKAIQEIYTSKLKMTGVEINEQSCKELANNVSCNVFNDSILNYNIENKHDVVLTMGLLIHIDPMLLDQVYDILYHTSSKYICIAEYYNRTPVSIEYRGEINKLFKRDFAGEMLNKYPDLKLVNYGFVYHKDPNYPLDDITWFLLKKKV